VAGGTTGPAWAVPKMMEATLKSRGLITTSESWDPTTGARITESGISEETKDRILAGVKDWYSSQVDMNSQQYFDTSGWDWNEVLAILRSASVPTMTAILETTYPQEAQNYYTIFADDGTGTLKAIPVPEASLTNMRQYSSKTLDTKQLHAAMVVGYANDVDWESILFVSDYLGGLDPVEYYGATVTDPFSGTVTPGMPTARPQINQDFVSIADRLKAGAGLYQGDEAFAILHATDPNLAGRVRNNPFKLTGEEVDRAKAILGDYSAFSAQPSSPPAAWSLQYINSLLPAGLEEPMTREEKPENVRKTYEDMYRQWFMETPTEAELDGFVAHFDRELDAYQRRVQGSVMNPFDTPELVQVGHGEMRHWEPALPGFEETQPTAAGQARSFLRSDDLYGPLYSKKPGGLTEEAYGQVMSGAAMTALGGAEGALAEGSIRAGMISGDTRSVARHAVYTGGAEQSSTLTGRLARAGDVFRRMT
jgi:hypothetical protein